MAANTKRRRAIRDQIEPGKLYGIDEALGLLKDMSKVKFTESVDVAVRLGIDPRKSDQVVRGATVLPHGTGKSVRVAPPPRKPGVGATRSPRPSASPPHQPLPALTPTSLAALLGDERRPVSPRAARYFDALANRTLPSGPLESRLHGQALE